jgi:hypothetical protein
MPLIHIPLVVYDSVVIGSDVVLGGGVGIFVFLGSQYHGMFRRSGTFVLHPYSAHCSAHDFDLGVDGVPIQIIYTYCISLNYLPGAYFFYRLLTLRYFGMDRTKSSYRNN